MKFSGVIAVIFFFAVAGVVYYGQRASAGVGDNLSGWAWSDNVGWISLNSVNQGDARDYGVTAGGTGALSGYAWSPNVGWISFNAGELATCPATAGNPTCAPNIDHGTGALSGWARACAGTVSGDCAGASRDDGWDGWISLKGDAPAYGVHTSSGTPCHFSGWAWGGPVVGWVNFDGVSGSGNACAIATLPISVSCFANPNPALISATIMWSASVGGGVAPYQYAWSGTDGLSGNTASVAKLYTTATPKQATVNVTDAVGSRVAASCNLVVASAPVPIPVSLVVSCSANPNPAFVNQAVVWRVAVTGGAAPYSYSWSGTGGLSGTGATVSKSYTTVGSKQATVSVSGAGGSRGAATCNAKINPIGFREVAP